MKPTVANLFFNAISKSFEFEDDLRNWKTGVALPMSWMHPKIGIIFLHQHVYLRRIQ